MAHRRGDLRSSVYQDGDDWSISTPHALIAKKAVDRNPVLLIPKHDRRRRIERRRREEASIPTVGQFEKIVENIRSQQFSDTAETTADFVSFFALCGIGEAEARSVCWEDIDWKEGRINFVSVKTGRPFYTPINFPWLKDWLTDFWKRRGNPTTGRIFNIHSAPPMPVLC
jgi:integrase